MKVNGVDIIDREHLVETISDWGEDAKESILSVYDGVTLPKQEEPPRLRIFNFIEEYQNPRTTDFTIIGLTKEAPAYEKGRKVRAQYHDPKTGDIVVEKIFKDIIRSGRLSSLDITFNWYDESGEVSVTKTDTVRNYSFDEAETALRHRRAKQMDYLKGFSRGTPLEAYMDVLFSYYEHERLAYVESGSVELQDAIMTEDDSDMLAILNAPVSEGVTVSMAILNQIT